MASNYPPKKNVAFTMYFFIHKSDGTIIANPTLTGSNVHVDGNTTEVTDSTLAVVDSTTGLCSIVLAQATMNGDQIDGTVTSSSTGAVVKTFKLMTAANTQDEIGTDLAATHTHAAGAETQATEANTHAHNLETTVGAAGAGLTAVQLTADYDAAKTAAQAGDEMDLIDAPNATAVTAIQSGLAATVADAVWDEATADHVAAGSTGKALSDAGSAGDPWATPIPGAYGAGTAGKAMADVLEDTSTTIPALFAAGSVTLTAPVSTDGDTVTLVQGDDYYLADSRHLSWTDSGSEWPSLTGATIHFTVRNLATGVDTETHGVVSDANTCYVELPNTTTVLWDAGGKFRFDLEATLAGTSHKVTLVTGTVTMAAKYSG